MTIVGNVFQVEESYRSVLNVDDKLEPKEMLWIRILEAKGNIGLIQSLLFLL